MSYTVYTDILDVKLDDVFHFEVLNKNWFGRPSINPSTGLQDYIVMGFKTTVSSKDNTCKELYTQKMDYIGNGLGRYFESGTLTENISRELLDIPSENLHLWFQNIIFSDEIVKLIFFTMDKQKILNFFTRDYDDKVFPFKDKLKERVLECLGSKQDKVNPSKIKAVLEYFESMDKNGWNEIPKSLEDIFIFDSSTSRASYKQSEKNLYEEQFNKKRDLIIKLLTKIGITNFDDILETLGGNINDLLEQYRNDFDFDTVLMMLFDLDKSKLDRIFKRAVLLLLNDNLTLNKDIDSDKRHIVDIKKAIMDQVKSIFGNAEDTSNAEKITKILELINEPAKIREKYEGYFSRAAHGMSNFNLNTEKALAQQAQEQVVNSGGGKVKKFGKVKKSVKKSLKVRRTKTMNSVKNLNKRK